MSSFNPRILIVDDNRAIHADFRKILCPNRKTIDADEVALFGDGQASDSGPVFELDFAAQGQEALQMVSAAANASRPYAMAFIDVRMPPGWDGIETMSRIWGVDPELQMVICTAYSDYSWEQLDEKLKHPDRFVILKKPFDVVEVLQLTNAFTAKWRLQQQVKEHTRELEESEKRFRFLADTVPGIVWTASPDGSVDYANQRLSHYSGKSLEQNKGWGWQEILHPDDRQNCLKQWSESLKSGNPYQVEHRLKCEIDGSYRWHLTRAVPLRDDRGQILQWVGTSIDIEDQKRNQEALRQAQGELEQKISERTAELSYQRDMLNTLLETSPDFIFFKDKESRFVHCSKAFEKLFRVADVEYLRGKTDFDFFTEEHARPAYEDEQEIIRTGRPIVGKLEKETHPDGRITWCLTNKQIWRDKDKNIIGTLGTSKDVTPIKMAEEELRAQRESFRAITDNAPDAIARIDSNLRFVYVNRVVENTLGIGSAEMLGKTNTDLGLPAQEQWNQATRRVFETGQDVTFEFQVETPAGQRFCEVRLVPEHSTSGGVLYVLAVTRDVTETKKVEKERQLMDVQLRQAQKLESIGQLAAGIAHEINTPTQYVGDNTRFLKDSFESIFGVLRAYEEMLHAAKMNAVTPELVARLEQVLETSDLAYLFEQIPAAIKETLEGVERVTKIVRAMKEFSHPGGKEKSLADLNKAIETTVTVARNEWKYVADMNLRLDPALPAVPCFLSEFNQIILNLVVNAAHAISDVIKQQPGTKGTITIATRRDKDQVEVRVSDTGTGIPEAIRSKIFDPFFTTKDVGKGTGQGLSIVYGSIVKKHGGSVHFETELGKGTTFILRLPIAPAPAEANSGKAPASHSVPLSAFSPLK